MALKDATKKSNKPKSVQEIAKSNAPGSNVARALLKADPNYKIGQTSVNKTPASNTSTNKSTGTYVSGPLSNSQIDTFASKGVTEGKYIPNTKLRLLPDGSLIKEDEPTVQDKQINNLKTIEEDTPIAVDNGTSRNDEKKMRDEIRYKSERGPLDLSYLTGAEEAAREAWKDKEVTANAIYDRMRSGTEQTQKSETGAMSAGLARAGGYLGFTGSGESMMLSLERSHRAEILDIESRRTQALAEARQAYNEQMYDVALEKQRLADAYEKQQYEEKQRYFEEVKRIQKEDADKAEQERVNVEIYNALQGGAKDEMEVFGKLKGTATPEQIQEFFKQIAPKTTSSDLFKPTTTQTSMLIGAGFGSDDIQTIYDHLNEYGYDDTLRASLTPYQRRVMDDILTMKSEKVAQGGASVKITPTNKNKLIGAGFSVNEVDAFESDVNEFGLDVAVKGIQDQEQLDVINKIYGSDYSVNVADSEETTMPAPEQIRSDLVTSLTKNKDLYSREEAYEIAINKLKEQYGDNIPNSYEMAVDRAIRDVYGDDFWQNIIPGGRGNFPLTPEG